MMARHAILSTCGVCMLFLPISISECEKAAYSIHWWWQRKKNTEKSKKRPQQLFIWSSSLRIPTYSKARIQLWPETRWIRVRWNEQINRGDDRILNGMEAQMWLKQKQLQNKRWRKKNSTHSSKWQYCMNMETHHDRTNRNTKKKLYENRLSCKLNFVGLPCDRMIYSKFSCPYCSNNCDSNTQKKNTHWTL